MQATHIKFAVMALGKLFVPGLSALLRPQLYLLRPQICLLLLASYASTALASDTATIDIEAELASFSTELEQLNRAITANQTLFEKRAINDKNQVAKRNLRQAQSLAENGDILAARYALSDFITDIQTLSPEDATTYTELLIHILRQTGQNNTAFNHYLKYLQYTLQTDKANQAKVNKILNNLSNLAASPNMDAQTLRQALPVLRIVSQTDEYKNAALYICARIANEIGLYQITAEFLDEMDFTQKSDPKLHSKTKFFRSLIDLRLGQPDKALTLLDELLTQKLSDESLMAMALLARGRILAERKQFSDALQSYSKVPSRSPFYHDALYETVITATEARQYAGAKTAAQKLLATFPNSVHTYRTRGLLSYIDLQQKNFKAAEANIQDLLSRYAKQVDVIQKTTSPSIEQFATLVDDLRLHLSPLPEWLEILALDQDLQQYEARAQSTEAQIRAFTYELGGKSFNLLEPHLRSRITKHTESGQKLVAIAARLAHAQTTLYESDFRSHDKIRLHHIDQVFEETLQKRASSQILPKHALALGQYLTYIQHLRRLSLRKSTIDAEIAALRFHAAKETPVAQVTRATSNIASLHKRLLTRINHIYLKNLPDLSAYYAGQRQFTREASLLVEKSSIINAYSQKMESRTARLLNKGFDQAWSAWSKAASNYLQVGQQLEETMQERSNTVVATLQNLLISSYGIHRKASVRRLALEDILNRYWPTYKSIATERLREEIIRQKKWLADLNSAQAQDELAHQQEILSKLQVEQEILLDKMTINLSGDSLSW